MNRMVEEAIAVLELPETGFVHFSEPLTVTEKNGPVRDRAIGIYNYVHGTFVFFINDVASGLIAANGSMESYWYRLGASDVRLMRAFLEVQRKLMKVHVDIAEMDVAAQ